MGGDFWQARRYDSATASHGVKRGAACPFPTLSRMRGRRGGAIGVIREHNMSTTGWVVLGVIVVIAVWLNGVYNGLKRAAFMRRVALHGLHQVWDEIVALA